MLNVGLSNLKVHSKEDLLATVKLTNLTPNKLLVYKYSDFNYEKRGLNQNSCVQKYYFVIQKKGKGGYFEQEQLANIGQSPVYDSLGNSADILFDTLQTGQSKVIQFNLLGYYRLQKGDYRVRFSCKLPARDKQQSKIIFSSWIPFEVKSKKVEYIY